MVGWCSMGTFNDPCLPSWTGCFFFDESWQSWSLQFPLTGTRWSRDHVSGHLPPEKHGDVSSPGGMSWSTVILGHPGVPCRIIPPEVCKMNVDTDTQWAYWEGEPRMKRGWSRSKFLALGMIVEDVHLQVIIMDINGCCSLCNNSVATRSSIKTQYWILMESNYTYG